MKFGSTDGESIIDVEVGSRVTVNGQAGEVVGLNPLLWLANIRFDHLDIDMHIPIDNIDPQPQTQPGSQPQKEDIMGWAEGKIPDPEFNGNCNFIPFAFHLVPVRGLAKVAAVMRKGERKGRSGWGKVPVEEHINHAICHLLAYLAGRRDKPHLANAGCRVLMAADLDSKEVLPRVTVGEGGCGESLEEGDNTDGEA